MLSPDTRSRRRPFPPFSSSSTTALSVARLFFVNLCSLCTSLATPRIVARSVSNSSSPTDFVVAHVPERDLRLAPTRSTTTKSVGALDAAVFARDTTRQTTFAFAFAFAFASSARVVVVSCAETFAYASNRTRNRASVVCAETRDGDDARVSLVVSLVARHVVVVVVVVVITIIIIIIIFPNDPSHVRLPMPTDETDRPTDETDRRTVARAPRASRLAPRARSSSPVARRSSSAWGDGRESL